MLTRVSVVPGTKRAAEDDAASGPTTRSAKAPKTDPKGRKGGKKGPKVSTRARTRAPPARSRPARQASMAASTFKARALPLHVNITHTPPVIGDDTATAASADPGFVGTTALLPSTFSTGSYGWKGNKRITIELESGEGGEKEKVHVMLTINATVMGSKGAKEDDGEEHAEDVPEADAKEAATKPDEKAEEDEAAPERQDA
ncbi:hypothetical protein B0H21DRAFT_711119 [Amylocystis lapponica]|nr:hypothetical protein B0H21DRAFT_711119 [Amylocystis lapponica]